MISDALKSLVEEIITLLKIQYAIERGGHLTIAKEMGDSIVRLSEIFNIICDTQMELSVRKHIPARERLEKFHEMITKLRPMEQ